jgi:hypothetical protein
MNGMSYGAEQQVAINTLSPASSTMHHNDISALCHQHAQWQWLHMALHRVACLQLLYNPGAVQDENWPEPFAAKQNSPSICLRERASFLYGKEPTSTMGSFLHAAAYSTALTSNGKAHILDPARQKLQCATGSTKACSQSLQTCLVDRRLHMHCGTANEVLQQKQ